jgi:uncharacterized tellurite resistance protein B-like protein
MANFLTRLFRGGPATATDTDIDPLEAAAALLVEAALVDGVYANLESDMIAEILITSFGMEADHADRVLEKGERLAEHVTDAYALTRHVKKLSLADRTKVVECLHRVSLADGEACKFEQAFIRHVASLLHVDDVRRAQARRRAENQTL